MDDRARGPPRYDNRGRSGPYYGGVAPSLENAGGGRQCRTPLLPLRYSKAAGHHDLPTPRPFILWAIFMLCWFSQDTEAVTELSNGVFCTDVFDVGMVCATGLHTTTPCTAEKDGMTTYLGGYDVGRLCAISVSYTIPSPADIDGGYWDFFKIANAANETTGLEIMTTSDDNHGLCEVNVKYPDVTNAVGCKSCFLCGNATTLYSADCTNLMYGRMVDCESSSVADYDIYFPLTAEALVVYAAAPGGDSNGGGSDGGPSDGQDAEGSSEYNVTIIPPGGPLRNATESPGGPESDATVLPGGSEGEATVSPGGSEGDATLPPGGSEGEATLPPGGSATNVTDEGIVGDGGINATEEPRANRALYALTTLVVLLIAAIAYLLLVKQRRTTPPPNSTSEAGLLQPPSSHGTIDVPRDPKDDSLRVELPNNKDQCRTADPPLAYAVAIDSKSSDFAV